MRARTLNFIASLVASTSLLVACGAGELGDTPIARCVPEGACDESMFQGGISAALGNAGRGQAIFARECSRCHGSDGKGLVEARNIDMTSPAWQATLRDSTIVKAVRSGRAPTMPAFAFSDDELRDLLAHIRTLEAAPTPAPKRGGY